MRYYLDFEKPLEELEIRIDELKQLQSNGNTGISSELETLGMKANTLRHEIFSNLTPWNICQIARHHERPYTNDYIELITDDFIEFHGDRKFSDDQAIVGGFATIGDFHVLIVGHQKGRGTRERIRRNFGQPHPDGYRKALRLMKLAERFNIPVVTFIDTPGAFPGVGAEERGQAEAIATNLLEISKLKIPTVSIVIGEGGSGGALAISVADKLFMLEYAIYSVISPEGCAAILWNKNNKNDRLNQDDFSSAANALKLTANDLLKFKVIEGIIEEPNGGAHRSQHETAMNIKKCIIESLTELSEKDLQILLSERYDKLKNIGDFYT